MIAFKIKGIKNEMSPEGNKPIHLSQWIATDPFSWSFCSSATIVLFSPFVLFFFFFLHLVRGNYILSEIGCESFYKDTLSVRVLKEQILNCKFKIRANYTSSDYETVGSRNQSHKEEGKMAGQFVVTGHKKWWQSQVPMQRGGWGGEGGGGGACGKNNFS